MTMQTIAKLISLLCLTATTAFEDNCELSNLEHLSHSQEQCLMRAFSELSSQDRWHLLHQFLHDSDDVSKRSDIEDAEQLDMWEARRNKRMLDLLKILLGSLRSYSLVPMVMSGVMGSTTSKAGPNFVPSPTRKPTIVLPAGPSTVRPPLPTIAPGQIDANTIRYPLRPAPTIPFLVFAPLPQGVSVPYPPLLQWPAQVPPAPTSPSVASPTQNPMPVPVTSTTHRPFLKSPSLYTIASYGSNYKPHLPMSGSLYSGETSANSEADSDNNLDDDSNDNEHDLPSSSVSYYSNEGRQPVSDAESHHNDYDITNDDHQLSYENSPDESFEDSKHCNNIACQNRSKSKFGYRGRYISKRLIPKDTGNLRTFITTSRPDPLLVSSVFHRSNPELYRIKSFRDESPSQFRIIIPPLPPRKKRDIFFDDAFNSFNLSSFDFEKIDLKSPPESTHAQFLENTYNGNLIPSSSYREKLEKDIEKYVENYVEKQISQGEINTKKPKTTVIELKTKNGSPIKTVTTTVSRIVESDIEKPFLETILDFSKSINPVVNQFGELAGDDDSDQINSEASRSKLTESFLDQFQIKTDRSSFSWNSY